MSLRFTQKRFNLLFILFCSLLSTQCINPVEPEFDFKDDLVFIEAIASNIKGGSYVKINESYIINDHFLSDFISEAKVVFKNLDTKENVILTENKLEYNPDENFTVKPGETWELEITMPDGRTYQSFPETILEPVSISDIEAIYDKNLEYHQGDNKFVPGHAITVSFDDPPADNNYYYWAYKAFEKKSICLECQSGTVYRNGTCERLNNPSVSSSIAFDYGCETDCWKINFNENVSIFSDEFSNGKTINSMPVANVLLNSRADILIELRQFTLTAASYEYYKVLKDILDNNGSLNAPPPAAFVGNIFNPDDSEEIVLGKFTAAATSTKSIFIDRTDITDEIVGGKVFNRFETCEVCDCAPLCIPVTEAPCEESRFSTGIQPEGWIE